MHILGSDGQLAPLIEEPYESEELLQRLLADAPELIPGELIDERDPPRWLLISRETGLVLDGAAKLSLDHLLVDQHAVPTLVEVKRSSDTRLRREVVAQMLDYAASLSAAQPGLIRSLLDERLALDSGSVDDAVAELLGEETDMDAFFEQVDANLQAGRVRLIFLADRIGAGLRQIIEFLNAQFSRIEVLGVEVRQHRGGGLTALTSSVIGNTAAATATKGRAHRITADDFGLARSGLVRRAAASSFGGRGWPVPHLGASDSDGWV
jgi:hypothetical protein